MSDYVWHPTTAYIEDANVTRLQRAYGLTSLQELRQRSVEDIAWYWDAVVKDLGLPFHRPYDKVVDLTAGIEHPSWFVAGELNLVTACVDRWRDDEHTTHLPAVVHEDEEGTVTALTYRELAGQVEAVSFGLRRLGIARGDTVALFLPMSPEAVVAFYAIARIGAIAVPLFSGFAPAAIASRLQDAEARAVVVADGTVRRGKRVAMRPLLDEALASCPSVRHLVHVDHLDRSPGPEVAQENVTVTQWSALVQAAPEPASQPVALTADAPLLLGYTSGTTGRPKGAVHTHAGFLVKTASEVAYSFDLKRGDVFCWVTDMGWIMGPLSIVGTHANGGTLLLYEGSPDQPDLERLWALAERHRVSMLGVSPTLIRTLRRTHADDAAARYDLNSVHVVGSTGEPWDPKSYEWLAEQVFGGRVPIINFSGGTEVGGSFLAPYPVEPIRSCSLGGPSLGMDVDVVDGFGHPVRGEVGELVCRQPWPSMTKGVWRDDERYLQAYWSTYPGMWRHGDFAEVAPDGQWFIRGRSDDVMNVAGKRLAPAEVESVISAHPAVAETAVVGVPDADKGESIWVFWVPQTEGGPDVSAELRDRAATELGRPFAPSVVHRVAALPKTRSAKILRRAIKATALDQPTGDLSGAENPEALDDIRRAIRGR